MSYKPDHRCNWSLALLQENCHLGILCLSPVRNSLECRATENQAIEVAKQEETCEQKTEDSEDMRQVEQISLKLLQHFR